VLVALAIAACAGGQPNPTVPALPGHSPHGQADALHLVGQCIRRHGFPAFPDPTIGATGQVTFDKTLIISAPRAVVVQALDACRATLARAGIGTGHGHGLGGPPSPQQLRQELAFARCMRAHGLPGMADPNPVTGEITLPPGVSKDSPVLQRAGQVCRSRLSGKG
jgi:hypothetical protein